MTSQYALSAESYGLDWMARAGYAARGTVYLLIGGLALWAAVGTGGRTTDSRGALATLQNEPLGQILLGLITLGLLGYAGWRLVQGLGDADHHGHDTKALVIRGGLVVSALVHISLAFFAGTLALGESGGDSGGGNQGWTVQLMQLAWGRWLVGLIGAIVIGVGIAQVVKGWNASFLKHFSVSGQELGKTCKVCQFGLIARGVVFGIIGGFIINAALSFDPQKAQGLKGAFSAIQQQPYGTVLMVVVSLGLLAFSAYSFVEARYRRVSH